MLWANKATIGMAAVLVVVITVYNCYYLKEMSDLSTQAYLRLYGSSIYEHHALTGKWPSTIDDLARTSLPVQNRHWKAQLDVEADVIVWPKDMKPDPKENGRVILGYHNKGPDAETGRMWVCWGDLRTGCITPEELQDNLNKLTKVKECVDAKLVGVWQNRSDAGRPLSMRPGSCAVALVIVFGFSTMSMRHRKRCRSWLLA